MLLSFLNHNSYCGLMIEVVFGIILTVLLLYLWFYVKRKTFHVYDPFGYSYIIVTQLKCRECKLNGIRLFKKGDYVFGVREECPRCKKGDFVIVGIFWEKPKTVEELKSEKLEKKWR